MLLKHFFSATNTKQIPPTPPWNWPFIGHILSLGPMPFLKATDWARKHGDVYQIRLGPHPTVVINGAKTIRDVLMKNGDDVGGRPNFHTFRLVLDGQSMIFNSSTSPGWRVKRGLMQKAIKSYMVNNKKQLSILLTARSNAIVAGLLKSQKSYQNGEGTNPKNILWRQSSALFHQILISNPDISPTQRENETKQLVNLFDSIMNPPKISLAADIFSWMQIFQANHTRLFREINKHIHTTLCSQQVKNLASYKDGVIRDVTDGLSAAHQNCPESDLLLTGITGPEGHLKTLQLMGDLIGAGQSTLATSLRWLFLHMAMFPHIQDRVHSELHQNDLIDLNTPVPCEYRNKRLPFTTAVILESQRYACIFPFLIPHATTCDTTMGGYHVSKDTILLFNVWSATRDTRLWGDDVDEFYPDRFIDETTGQVNRQLGNKTLAFGAGRRSCIGEQLGATTVFVLFAEIMRRIKITLPDSNDTPSLLGNFGFDHSPPYYRIIVEPIAF